MAAHPTIQNLKIFVEVHFPGYDISIHPGGGEEQGGHSSATFYLIVMRNDSGDNFMVPHGEDSSRWFLYSMAKFMSTDPAHFSNISLSFDPLALNYRDRLTDFSIIAKLNSMYQLPFEADEEN